MSVHKDEKTNTWYFKKRIKNIDGKITNTTKRGFKTKKEAQTAEVMYRPENINKSQFSFNDLCNYYLDYLKSRIKPSTLYGKQIMINKYIRNYFNDSNIENITNQEVFNWQSELQKNNLSAHRINAITSELKLLFDYGERFHNTKNNPARIVGSIRDTTIKQEKMKIWTPNQFNTFISNCQNVTYYTLFNLLYFTGIRKGEALALTWNDINYFTKQLSISKSLSRDYDSSTEIKYKLTLPKSNSGIRIIDLPDKVFNLLMKYKQIATETYKLVLPNSFIFGNDRPLGKTNIERYKNKICEISNLPQIRIHDFRHSHASLLISMGINPLFISERLGHKDVSTTLDTYSHLFPTNQKEIVMKLDSMISNF